MDTPPPNREQRSMLQLLEQEHISAEHFLNNARLSDILEYSLLSEENARRVTAHSIRVQCLEVKIAPHQVAIVLKDFQPTDTEWRMRSLMIPRRDPRPAQIFPCGTAVDCLYSEGAPLYYATVHEADDLPRAVELAVRHLHSLFTRDGRPVDPAQEGNVFGVIYNGDGSIDHRIWDSLVSCFTIQFFGTVTNEILDEFFNRFRVINGIAMHVDSPGLENHFQRIRQLRMLRIKNAHWLTPDHLRQVRCHTLVIKSSRLESGDVAVFLNEWITGNHPTERIFIVSDTHDFNHDLIAPNGPWETTGSGDERQHVYKTGIRVLDNTYMRVCVTGKSVSLERLHGEVIAVLVV